MPTIAIIYYSGYPNLWPQSIDEGGSTL